jgi:hypothetical protein
VTIFNEEVRAVLTAGTSSTECVRIEPAADPIQLLFVFLILWIRVAFSRL